MELKRRENGEEKGEFVLFEFLLLVSGRKKKREKKKTHQRVLGDRQLPAQVPAKGVDMRRLGLLHDLFLLLALVRGSSHHLAARGAPPPRAVAVVDAGGIPGVVPGLGRREVDAHGRVRAVDGGVDGSLYV